MHIEPKITFEQYKATLEAMRKPANRRFGKSQWLRVMVIVVFSFTILVMIKTSAVPSFFIVIVILFVLWLSLKYITHFCLKRSYKAQEKHLNEQQMDLSENGISGHSTDGTISYEYKWPAFERFIDIPDAFILLPNAASFIRIPKNLLTAEDQQQIIRWGMPTT